jgi:hypothetical protein
VGYVLHDEISKRCGMAIDHNMYVCFAESGQKDQASYQQQGIYQ